MSKPMDTRSHPPDDTAGASIGEGGHTVAGALRSGMLWNLLNFVASQVSGLLIFLVLAHQLPPDIFGLVALSTVIADIVANEGRYAGMDAILQANIYDRARLDSAFWAFMAVCIVFAVGLIGASPFMAEAYGSPLLGQFVPVFALMLLTTPWLSVMDALIMRNLGFKQLTQRNILATLLGGAAGIAVAFSPYVLWALVVQRVVGLLTAIVFQYHYTGWAPGFSFQRAAMADFSHRLAPLWAVSMLSFATTRISTLLFGLRYDATTVGLLRAAYRLTETVQGPLVSPLMGLWFPLMAKVRGNLAGEREVYLSILRTAAFVALPAFTGLVIVTKDLVTVFLPESYHGAAEMMQALCLVCLMIPIAWFNPIAMNSMEMNKAALIYMVISVVASITALLAVPNVTPTVAILVMSAPGLIYGIAGNIFLNRRLKLSNARHFGGLLPAAAASLAMGLTTFILHRHMAGYEPLVRLVTVSVAGVLVYGGYLFAFHRPWTLDRIQLLRGRSASDV